MSIIFDQTFAEACVDWLAANPHLSAASKTSYQGEIDRLGQYVAAKFGLLKIGQLNPGHWEQYLRAMRRSRKTVRTRRSDVLKASSLLQAMRISRQFLIWCAEQDLLNWWPPRVKLAPSIQARAATESPLEIPALLRLALAGGLQGEPSAQEARALLAINLAYWGALDAGELSELKVSQMLTRARDGLLLVGGAREVRLPHHVHLLWRNYLALREEELDTHLVPDAPLLASLGAQAPLRPWSIWAMVKSWQEDRGIRSAFSPRTLRAAYLRSTQASESAGVAASLSHAGIVVARVSAATGDISPQIRRIQRQEMRRLSA